MPQEFGGRNDMGAVFNAILPYKMGLNINTPVVGRKSATVRTKKETRDLMIS